jgi:hypothetical protein
MGVTVVTAGTCSRGGTNNKRKGKQRRKSGEVLRGEERGKGAVCIQM